MRRPMLILALLGAMAGPSFAAPASCEDPCEVNVTSAGYVSPVTAVLDGTTIRWTSLDASHPTTEATNDEPCFTVDAFPGLQRVPVRFRIVGGEVQATTNPGTPAASTATCSSAVGTSGDASVLPYRCLLHPWMNAALLIEA